MTTSRALIADSRRASRGRVEKSVTAMDGQRTAGAGSCLTQRARPAPFCSHNIPKQDATRARTTHQQKTWNCALSNAFPARSEGYRSWPSCTHNPKVAGSNPAPATIDDEGLADAGAANPFRLPRLQPRNWFVRPASALGRSCGPFRSARRARGPVTPESQLR